MNNIIFSCLIIKLDRTQNDTISMNGWYYYIIIYTGSYYRSRI